MTAHAQAAPVTRPDWFDRLPYARVGALIVLAFCAGILVGWAWVKADLTGSIMGNAHWQLTHIVKTQTPSEGTKPKGCPP